MELGVLNKIDRELNNSEIKILIKIPMMKIMMRNKTLVIHTGFFIIHQKSIKLQPLTGLQDKQEFNLIMVSKMAEEENKEEVDLGEKLEKLVEEIKEVMERRKERIAELRAEIERIEQDNVSLENTIGELLKGF